MGQKDLNQLLNKFRTEVKNKSINSFLNTGKEIYDKLIQFDHMKVTEKKKSGKVHDENCKKLNDFKNAGKTVRNYF